jgi:hypothetical protein
MPTEMKYPATLIEDASSPYDNSAAPDPIQIHRSLLAEFHRRGKKPLGPWRSLSQWTTDRS